MPCSESVCEISPQEQSSVEVIVSFLVLIELSYGKGVDPLNGQPVDIPRG